MKKIFITAFISCVLYAQALSQIKSVSGGLGYTYQYSEDLVGNALWLSRTRTPSVDLSLSGILLTEDLAEFELQTFFTQSSMSSRGSAIPLDFGMQNWTLYRLSLSVLQYSPVWITYNARDGYVKTTVDYNSPATQEGKTRSRDQGLSLSVRKISFLPPITLGYNRSRSWVVEGPELGTLSESYTFSSNASNGSTNFNISGQTTMAQNDQNNIRSKASTLNFNGSKSFTPTETMDLQSEYSWYDQFSLLRAGLLYRGYLENQSDLTGGLNFSQTTSGLSQVSIYSVSANYGHSWTNQWRYSIGVGDVYSKQTIALSSAPPLTPYNTWRTNLGLSQMTNLNGGSIGSSLSVGGEWTANEENSSTYTGSLSINYVRGFGYDRLMINLGTNVSSDHRLGKYQNQIGNRLNITMDARLFPQLLSTTKAIYTDNISRGTFLGGYLNRYLTASEDLKGNFFFVVPFSATGGIAATWYFGDLKGTTYGWNLTFMSGRFFVDRLTFTYQYSRYYEVLYRNPSANHSIQLQYYWRMFSFSVNAYQRTNYTRQRGFSFTIMRPF